MTRQRIVEWDRPTGRSRASSAAAAPANCAGNREPAGQAVRLTSSRRRTEPARGRDSGSGSPGGPRQTEHRPGLQRRPDAGPALGRRDPSPPASAARPSRPAWLRTSITRSSKPGGAAGRAGSRGIAHQDRPPVGPAATRRAVGPSRTSSATAPRGTIAAGDPPAARRRPVAGTSAARRPPRPASRHRRSRGSATPRGPSRRPGGSRPGAGRAGRPGRSAARDARTARIRPAAAPRRAARPRMARSATSPGRRNARRYGSCTDPK